MKSFIFRLIALVAFLCVGCVLYGLLVEPKHLKIRQVDFVSNKYSGPPLRIGLITDIHIGGMHVPPERVKALVSEMNALSPDIILMPGDFVDGHLPPEKKSAAFNAAVETGVSYLSRLDAPAFATIGNHDAWYDAARITELLNEARVTVLDNESHSLEAVCLVGLADEYTGNPDRAAFDDCPDGLAPLVLTHSPQTWDLFRTDTVLAVAGHTHGGQVNLPLIGRRVNSTTLGPEHSYGFSKLGIVDIFVSAGVGTSILPVRFRSPPEIVLITLRGYRNGRFFQTIRISGGCGLRRVTCIPIRFVCDKKERDERKQGESCREEEG